MIMEPARAPGMVGGVTPAGRSGSGGVSAGRDGAALPGVGGGTG